MDSICNSNKIFSDKMNNVKFEIKIIINDDLKIVFKNK